jgi:hypothetical protein
MILGAVPVPPGTTYRGANTMSNHHDTDSTATAGDYTAEMTVGPAEMDAMMHADRIEANVSHRFASERFAGAEVAALAYNGALLD